MENKKKKNGLLWLIALIIVIAALLCVYFLTREKPNENLKNITVEIIYDDVDKTVPIKTEAEYLSGAMEEKGLIEGEESAYGLFITAVDGRVADDSIQEWWCITKGGTMLDTGADTTVIADGETYEFTLTTGW